MNKEQYKKHAKKKSPPTRSYFTTPMAFLVGGLICVLGQGIYNLFFQCLNLTETHASTMTTVSLIFLSALVTSLHYYDDIAKYAGAGTIVPVTGFANSIVAAAMEYKAEGIVLGMSAKMFTIAGPVLVFGISGSVVYGIVYFLFLR